MRKCRSEFGERFFPSLAKSLRPSCPRCVWIRRGIWSFALPVAIILAVSGCFEIIESIVAEIVAPGKGVRWLGGQGDEWDAQNDMVSALVGSLLMVGVVALLQWKKAPPHLHPLTLSPLGETHAHAPVLLGPAVRAGE